jgi:hypothetical protein
LPNRNVSTKADQDHNYCKLRLTPLKAGA